MSMKALIDIEPHADKVRCGPCEYEHGYDGKAFCSTFDTELRRDKWTPELGCAAFRCPDCLAATAAAQAQQEEIERLREVLREIADLKPDSSQDDCKCLMCYMAGLAEAALKGAG